MGLGNSAANYTLDFFAFNGQMKNIIMGMAAATCLTTSACRTGWRSRSGDLIQLFLGDGSIPWATTRKIELHHRSNPIRSRLSCYLSFGSLSQGLLIGASLRSIDPKLREGGNRWCVRIRHTTPPGNNALHLLRRPLLDHQHISDRDQLSLTSVNVCGFSRDHHPRLALLTIFSFSNPCL